MDTYYVIEEYISAKNAIDNKAFWVALRHREFIDLDKALDILISLKKQLREVRLVKYTKEIINLYNS